MSPQDSSAQTPYVQSLTRGLTVIRSFSAEYPKQTLSQVAESTGLARATARRFLHTLISEGYASTDGTQFWLTPRILELGFSYMSSLGLPSIAQPHLEALSRRCNESCSLSVLDQHDVVYVNRVPVRRIMAVQITIGTRFPAHATSMGRVLLADLNEEERDKYFQEADLSAFTPKTVINEAQLRTLLDDVQHQGFCLVDQELEAGLRSIAAPIRNKHGQVVAAINMSTQVALHPLDEVHTRLLPALIRTADRISHDLIISDF